ncbi:MAG TPA: hypothetical protein VEL82_08710 [Thermoplasmata archaeon]|nr:hypothetical protein [Thermoplasmata archaeon]
MSYNAYGQPVEQRKSRPILVAIVAILIGIYGFLEFVVGLLIAVGSAALASLGSSFNVSVFGQTGVIAGAIVAIIGLIILGVAVGLWHLRLWALVLMLLFLAFEMVVYGLARDFISLGFILALVLFVYLLAVSRHFA